MELYLQLGHGMLGHAKELVSHWGTGTCILSPKNMSQEQMVKVSSELAAIDGSVLIDPQFYIPRTSQENLQTHSFWPQQFKTGLFFNGNGVSQMVNAIYNDYILATQASAFIVPSLYLKELSDDWIKFTSIILNEVQKLSLSIPQYLTLCISEEILINEEKTHELIETLEDYPVNGFYIIPIHPSNSYLVDNVAWQLNLLDIIASIKTTGKKVIVGYSCHQQLLLALAKTDAICAGTFLKTRMFPLGDFDENDDESRGGRRSTWFYCPQSLSEYQLQFLDVAHRAGMMDELKHSSDYNSHYADILFSGAQPTTLNFSEREAFRHYLQALRHQCALTSKDTYEKTKIHLEMVIDTALDLAGYFHQNGIRAKHRDFANVGDSTLSAITAFDNTWGLRYKAKWNNI